MFNSTQRYVIKFISELRRQVGGFLRLLRFSSTNKTDPHNITEILLKVALYNITLPTVFLYLSSVFAWLFNVPMVVWLLFNVNYFSNIQKLDHVGEQ
jgi:hypothetical protein